MGSGKEVRETMLQAGKLLRYEKQEEAQTIVLHYENAVAFVSVLSSQIIRFFVPSACERDFSFAIEGKRQENASVTERFEDGVLVLETEALSVRIRESFHVDIYDAAGNPLCRDYEGSRGKANRASEEMVKKAAEEGHWIPPVEPPPAIEVIKRMEGGDCFYGLGDKTGYLNKRGYDYVMWNTDNPKPQLEIGEFRSMYKTFPFLMVLHDHGMYGLFFDNPCKSWFNLGKESDAYYWFGADQGNLDCYFIGGETPGEILQNYTWLTGRTPLPQRWTLGYHQSRWSYSSAEEVLRLAKTFREKDIPCDAIHLDIDYMEEFAVFTWNRKRFADPKALTQQLKEMGIRTVAIIDPGVKVKEGYAVYEEGMENGYFVKTPQGEVYHNTVWPGDAVFPDFSREDVRSWWGNLQRHLIEKGVSGVWNDMNEPASFQGPLPDDLVFGSGEETSDHAHLHNVYGHLMAKASYEGWKKQSGRRPFVITRACYSGSQKYAIGWTGDNVSIWAHLQMAIPQMCNIGISGMAMIGTDVGGFGEDTTPELFARWIQLGCFSPFFRNHTTIGSRYQEPWNLGEETEAISRKYIKLRCRLIPYLYDCYVKTEQTGMPVMRPLVLSYPKDLRCRNLNDEFMVGDQMLVAPVVCQGQRARMVYLPEGRWVDYWTGEVHTGNRYLVKEAPLDVCPIYVKAGTILPTAREESVGLQKMDEELILEVFDGDGSYIHYQDNGEDFAYQEGAYNLYRFEKKGDQITAEIIHRGYEPVYRRICAVQSQSPCTTLDWTRKEGDNAAILDSGRNRTDSGRALLSAADPAL